MTIGDTAISILWCAFVMKTKISIAFIGETRKSKGISRYFLCISSTCNLSNSRVPKNRQTENLGNFDGFQPFRMRTFQILRFAEIEINPCHSTSNTGTKKPNGVSPYGIKAKKMVVDLKKKSKPRYLSNFSYHYKLPI